MYTFRRALKTSADNRSNTAEVYKLVMQMQTNYFISQGVPTSISVQASRKTRQTHLKHCQGVAAISGRKSIANSVVSSMHAFLYLFVSRLSLMELGEGNYATYLSPDGQVSTNRCAGMQHMSEQEWLGFSLLRASPPGHFQSYCCSFTPD